MKPPPMPGALAAPSTFTPSSGRPPAAIPLAGTALPAMPCPAQPDPRALALHAFWLRHAGRPLDADTLPWIPVGSVGPVLVIGHASPAVADPFPAPSGCVQPVSLPPAAYEHLLAQLAQRESEPEAEMHSVQGDLADPEPCPHADRVLSASAAVRRLLAHFPLLPAERAALQRLEPHCRSFSEAPPPLAAALWFAARRGPVLPACIAAAVRNQAPAVDQATPADPEALALGCIGRKWFYAAKCLPAEQLEDRLLATLPEDAAIEWFWEAGASQGREEAAETPKNRPSQKLTTASAAKAEDGPVTLELDADRLRAFDPRALRATGQDLFLWLLLRALEEGASDLHIEPGLGLARARLRVHGELQEVLVLADGVCRTVVGAAKAAVGLASENFRPLDGAFSVRLSGSIWNVRANAYPVRKDYQKLVFRFLPRSSRRLGFADLLQPAGVIRRLNHAIRRPQGLILVCGPTGSGKTTTLMTCLSEINRPDINITTLEDPVEYEIQGLNQAEVDTARRVGWQELLPAVLRQDPDVILVGEIRDRATAETSLRAALTGHLVFATLHTLSSCKAIQRLLDLGVNPDMLSESLVLIQSQRLLARLCPHCRRTRPADAAQRALLAAHPNCGHAARAEEALSATADPGGCPACAGRGMAGRIAAMELVPVDAALAEAIGRGARASELRALADAAGHASLFEAAVALAAAGEITWEEARSEQGSWEGFA